MSTLRVDTIQNAAGTDSPISVPGTAKAWVNFNGTGTVAIRASYNVSSITDNGVGDYTVNFTTALADANYAIANGKDNSIAGAFFGYWTTHLQSASSFRMNHTRIDSGITYGDSTVCMFSVFR